MEKFQEQILKHLGFQKEKGAFYSLYTNRVHPEYGFSSIYERKGEYYFGIGDYTVSKDFSLPFDVHNTLIRFGNFHVGATHYQFEHEAPARNNPSSFFIIEDDLHGVQHWHRGDYYYGIEVCIYESYLKRLMREIDPGFDLIGGFLHNHTYRYLPEAIYENLEDMRRLADEGRLTPLRLESKILECLDALYMETRTVTGNGFAQQIDYGTITIGKDRQMRITSADISAVQKAHEIIRQNVQTPPTIPTLASMVDLSVQRLKAVFPHYYRMTIGEYINSVRMSTAARLLATSQSSVEEIAHQVGYEQSANFARMFRKTYGRSPREFRTHP